MMRENPLEWLFDILNEEGISFLVDSESTAVLIFWDGEAADFTVRFLAEDKPNLLQTIVAVPISCPEEKRAGMAELLTRVNGSLRIGAFSMSFQTGNITLRAQLFPADTPPTSKQLLQQMYLLIHTADAYFQAIARYIFDSDLGPAEAIAEVEMASAEDG